MMPKIKEVREVEKYKKGELREELGGELRGELKKILLPIHNRFNLVPQGRPVGSTALSHPSNS
jgi:hypothetical protein